MDVTPVVQRIQLTTASPAEGFPEEFAESVWVSAARTFDYGPVPVAWLDGSRIVVGLREAMADMNPAESGLSIDMRNSHVQFTDPARGVLNGSLAANSADISKVVYQWGDGSSDEVEPATALGFSSHTYTEPGTYTIIVTVVLNDEGQPYLAAGSPSSAYTFVAVDES